MIWRFKIRGFTQIVTYGFVAGVLTAAAAGASTLNIDYFTIGETDKDANHLKSGVFTDEVQNALGPDGLPVLNTTQYGCVTNCISGSGLPTDLTASGEFTYWSPAFNTGGANGASDVTYTGTGTITLPFNQPSNFFPPNGSGTNDSNGFQAAVLYGNLYAATTEQISFTIGSDDMAFAYLDGLLVCDDGGVHASTSVPCTSPGTISAGNHSLEVFFVDINNVQSGLTFAVNTTNVTTYSVSEPSALALMGAGLIATGFTRRRVRSEFARRNRGSDSSLPR